MGSHRVREFGWRLLNILFYYTFCLICSDIQFFNYDSPFDFVAVVHLSCKHKMEASRVGMV